MVLLELGASGQGAQEAHESAKEALGDCQSTDDDQYGRHDGGALTSLDFVNQLIELRHNRVHDRYKSVTTTAKKGRK